MTLPGFNAETSLYKTNVVQADGLVLSQFDPCNCRHRCCGSGICHAGRERACFLECITFCDG
jgi:hypothetical protein